MSKYFKLIIYIITLIVFIFGAILKTDMIIFAVSDSDLILKNISNISSNRITLGETIKLTANAVGGTGVYSYKYYFKPKGEETWSALTDSTKVSYYSHTPKQIRSYNYAIKITDSNNCMKIMYFTVNVKKSLTNDSTISESSIEKGTTITLTAKAIGGTAPYKYRYYCKTATALGYLALTDSTTETVCKHTPARAIEYNYAVKIADAKGNTVTKYFDVSVNESSELKLNKSNITMSVGETFSLKELQYSENLSLSYSSSNNKVVSVNKSSGKIVSKRKGTATITAKSYNGKRAICKVIVVEEKKTELNYEGMLADLAAVNPNYSKGVVWQINCQRCVPTYELRRRGYDVTALPNPNGGLGIGWNNCLELAKKCNYSVWGEITQYKQYVSKTEIDDLMKKWGNGARAQVSVKWNDNEASHTFVVERINGINYYIDPQTGEIGVESEYFSRSNIAEVYRIDDADVSELIKECYTSNTDKDYIMY